MINTVTHTRQTTHFMTHPHSKTTIHAYKNELQKVICSFIKNNFQSTRLYILLHKSHIIFIYLLQDQYCNNSEIFERMNNCRTEIRIILSSLQ